MSERDSAPHPPPLPHGLADPVPVVLGGTALWFLGFFVVLVVDRSNSTLLWTTLSGGLLGIIGYGVFYWQRRAARRGSRTAQQGLDDV